MFETLKAILSKIKNKKNVKFSYIFVTTGDKKYIQKPFNFFFIQGVTGTNFRQIGVIFGAGRYRESF